MMEEKILKKLNEIFDEFFGLDGQEIVRETTAADVAGWDSLVHIALVSEVEETWPQEQSTNYINVVSLC